MPLPTGTATPWRQIEDPSKEEDGSSVYTYFQPGERPGPSEALAEQLRVDGVAYSLGPALGLAERTQATLGWYGVNDNDDDVLCDENGWTPDGQQVDPLRCVVAVVDATEA